MFRSSAMSRTWLARGRCDQRRCSHQPTRGVFRVARGPARFDFAQCRLSRSPGKGGSAPLPIPRGAYARAVTSRGSEQHGGAGGATAVGDEGDVGVGDLPPIAARHELENALGDEAHAMDAAFGELAAVGVEG